MKKTWLIPTFVLSFSLFSPLNSVSATNTSYAGPIYALTDEAKTSYFKVTMNITDQEPTQTAYEAFKVVKDAYESNVPTSEINVPSNQVSMALYYMMDDYRDPSGFSMNDRETFKNIKIELKSKTPVTVPLTYKNQENLVKPLPIVISKNTWLQLDDTITMDGSTTSPMLTNTKERNTNPYATSGYRPYNYNSNIVIEGGTWDSNRDENKVVSEGFTLGNASNVLVRNVTIKDIAGGHAIDAAGVNGLVIENNQFLGSALTGTSVDRDYNEAIQLDQMASSGPFGGESSSWGLFDGSVTKNVMIANNVFGASTESRKDSVPWQVGIGSHSVVKGQPYENLVIQNNTFNGMDNAGIRMTNYKDALVTGNRFLNNDIGIKIYSTNYAYDYSSKKINNHTLYPAVNDSILIQNNTFDGFKSFATHINSVGYGGGANGMTKNVKLSNNTYKNGNILNAFYQYFARNTQLSDSHYDVNGYVIDKNVAINHTNSILVSGLDASYTSIYSDQLYRISIPVRFKTKATADYAAYLIKKNTGTPAYVKTEAKNKYYVYTDYILGVKRAKDMKYIIENKMQYKYKVTYTNADHTNNLYRVGLTTRFTTYAQAKKASDDLYRIAKASSVITKEANGKYYVRTSSVLGKKRADQIQTLMKKKTTYKPFSYNTNQMLYYQITVHPFFGKANADKQAQHLKDTYKWIESIPVLSKF